MRSNGFSLIELMVVVSIIGILAAIALPAYSDYVARTQAVEPLKMGSGLQTDIATYYWEHGAFPGAGHALLADAVLLEGKYIPAGNMTLTPGSGRINALFASGSNAGSLMTMTPFVTVVPGAGNHIIKWQCGGLSLSRLPSGCR